MQRVPYSMQHLPADEAGRRVREFYHLVKTRRSIREFSPDPIPDEVLRDALRAAGTAPSGANLQPWHFVVIRDPEVKKAIRMAAEEEERAFYSGRAPREWLDTLAPLGTDAEKPFLETAPVLIAIFAKSKVAGKDGELKKTYYPKESVGIATGMLITALHAAGVGTLTHTPSPMQFLNKILNRPTEDKPFLLLVAGYPAKGCTVPEIEKLPLGKIASFQ